MNYNHNLYTKLLRFINKIIPYRHRILLSSTFAVFLLAIVSKTLELQKSRRKLSKSQSKDLLQSKLFFKSVYQKIRIEITGNEGIKYSKMQSFLDQISHKHMKHNFNNSLNGRSALQSNQKVIKEDKVFYSILNSYLNKKQQEI